MLRLIRTKTLKEWGALIDDFDSILKIKNEKIAELARVAELQQQRIKILTDTLDVMKRHIEYNNGKIPKTDEKKESVH